MRVDRRHFILTALTALSTVSACRRGVESDLEAAVRYLWSAQAADGGFHSETYGLLSSGQSLTPFVLNALLDVPESIVARPRRSVDAALGFLVDSTRDGILGLNDPAVPDYPNYATALGVRALIRTGHEDAASGMIVALRRQQFSEDNGWTESDAPYGGWGMGGPVRRPPQPGHVDLSMTRSVLEAFAAAGAAGNDPVFERAEVYLSRSQNSDGGFFFSTVNTQTNKAGAAGEAGFASYGTATADGLLALRARGIPESDDRVIGARRWLEAHHEPDRAPGLDAGPYEGWDQGLRFYYAGTVARAMPELPVTLPAQGADGSFRNASNLVKEDDPLIATAFAVHALVAGERRRQHDAMDRLPRNSR